MDTQDTHSAWRKTYEPPRVTPIVPTVKQRATSPPRMAVAEREEVHKDYAEISLTDDENFIFEFIRNSVPDKLRIMSN